MRFSYWMMAVLFVVGCAAPEDFVISGKVIEVRFTDNVQDGDWFKLDEMEFVHTISDTTDLLSQPSLGHMLFFDSPTQDVVDRGLLPSSRQYFHVDGERQSEPMPAGRLAGQFIQRLYQKQVNLSEGDLIYQVGQAQFLILGGRVFVKRSDDANISVFSNADGRIFFGELKKDDPTYQKLFEQ